MCPRNSACLALIHPLAYQQVQSPRIRRTDASGRHGRYWNRRDANGCSDDSHSNATRYNSALIGLLQSEILCTRSDSELRNIERAYNEIFDRDLQDDIKSETGGDLETCYIMLLSGQRKSRGFNETKKDIKALYKAGEGKWGTNEKKFVTMLASTNRC